MNKPQPYPEFTFIPTTPPTPNTNPRLQVPDLAQISFDNFPQNSKLPILPPSKEYINTIQYPPEPQQDTYSNFNTKDSNYQKPKPLKLRYVPPSLGYGAKNPPKYKILPLQMYNKVIVNPVAPPPPPPVQLQNQIQKWTSCICVPPYLCKNGVLNSAGRFTQGRSAKYNLGNNVSAVDEMKITAYF